MKKRTAAILLTIGICTVLYVLYAGAVLLDFHQTTQKKIHQACVTYIGQQSHILKNSGDILSVEKSAADQPEESPAEKYWYYRVETSKNSLVVRVHLKGGNGHWVPSGLQVAEAIPRAVPLKRDNPPPKSGQRP